MILLGPLQAVSEINPSPESFHGRTQWLLLCLSQFGLSLLTCIAEETPAGSQTYPTELPWKDCLVEGHGAPSVPTRRKNSLGSPDMDPSCLSVCVSVWICRMTCFQFHLPIFFLLTGDYWLFSLPASQGCAKTVASALELHALPADSHTLMILSPCSKLRFQGEKTRSYVQCGPGVHLHTVFFFF